MFQKRSVNDTDYKFGASGFFFLNLFQGNDVFAKDGAVIISSSNMRQGMMKEWELNIPGINLPTIPAFPKEFSPKICFDDSLIIHFNNEVIKLIHYSGGFSFDSVLKYI